ncbi:MAG: fumarylacetoacetate hydrolase family protein [Candidatus Poseidoniaceae archaeon]|nr:fumarylacetoacetate hydrolase family protein [Candidatus Poseidoniaceae archaeon]
MDVWCAIRTYPSHAQELGNQTPKEPVFFLKPESSIIPFGKIDTSSNDIHHEIELVLKIGLDGNPEAMAIGLDLTKRNVQNEIKKQGLPWSEAKAFKDSAIIGEWIDFDHRATFTLSVNDTIRQQGALSKMSWNVYELINKLSEWAPLNPGDILFTGTPEGVGPLFKGDAIVASLYIENQCIIEQHAECV